MKQNFSREDLKKSAIILIEFQKTWTEKGFFYNLIKKEYESRNVLSNTLSLLETVRKNNLAVIQAPLILDKRNKAQYKRVPFLPKFFNRFTKGTWKAEFTPGVYHVQDIVVTGRTAFDATVDSNLEEILEDGKYENLFFCGFTTDHCVGETMEALEEKYNCILVADCTATRSAKRQERTEQKYKTVSSHDIIEALSH